MKMISIALGKDTSLDVDLAVESIRHPERFPAPVRSVLTYS
jgi:hypothetical protein